MNFHLQNYSCSFSSSSSLTNSLSSPSSSVSLSNLLLDHHPAQQMQNNPQQSLSNNHTSATNSVSSAVEPHAMNHMHPHPHPLFLHSDFRGMPSPLFDPRTALDLALAAAVRNSSNPSGSEPLDFYSQRLRQLAGGSTVSPSPGSPGFSRKPAMTPPSPLSPEDGKDSNKNDFSSLFFVFFIFDFLILLSP